MKTITESIYDSINEHADTAMKNIFGKEIGLSKSLMSLFSKLGMNHKHEYDHFIIYDDGCIEYTNRYLFTGTVCAKVYKGWLNRIISPNDIKKIKLLDDTMQLSSYPEKGVYGDDEQYCKPLNYIRAILNALTNKHYESDGINITITSLDYTKGDFDKDMCI